MLVKLCLEKYLLHILFSLTPNGQTTKVFQHPNALIFVGTVAFYLQKRVAFFFFLRALP